MTVGNAFEGYRFFKKTVWTTYKTSQGRKIVEFTGEYNLDLPGQQSDVHSNKYLIFRFAINNDKSFKLVSATLHRVRKDGNNEDFEYPDMNQVFTYLIKDGIYANN